MGWQATLARNVCEKKNTTGRKESQTSCNIRGPHNTQRPKHWGLSSTGAQERAQSSKAVGPLPYVPQYDLEGVLPCATQGMTFKLTLCHGQLQRCQFRTLSMPVGLEEGVVPGCVWTSQGVSNGRGMMEQGPVHCHSGMMEQGPVHWHSVPIQFVSKTLCVCHSHQQ